MTTTTKTTIRYHFDCLSYGHICYTEGEARARLKEVMDDPRLRGDAELMATVKLVKIEETITVTELPI